MSSFAKARVERLIRNAGAHRVSAASIDSLDEAITTFATCIAKYAVKIANIAGRKTVKEPDILLGAAKCGYQKAMPKYTSLSIG